MEEMYGNVDMSDEAMLARAQAIQQALQNKKRNASPNMKWLSVPPIVFQSPPKTLAEMAVYLAQFGDRELPRERVVIESEIGAGEFGSVCSGYLRRPDGSKLTIAIKTLKDSGNEASKVKFLQEASIMIQFKHPKIVALVGVVTKTEPALICLEFCELGSLRSYLMSDIVFEKMSDADLIRMACDVCSAMHYLGESGFVHRDLAARNVLVNKDFICKVCDFGLSQEAGEGAAEAAKDEKIPIRWTAPEAVIHHQFSTASDVWSFGILLWEMWSYGAMPYKGWTNEKVMHEVTSGYRLPNPKNCPSFIHLLMIECWNETYDERPAFYDVFQRLLAAWNIVKPISNYAVKKYDEHGKLIKKTEVKSQDEIDEDDAYDLGGAGGKIAKPQIVAASETDEDDDNMYDMGGVGGKVEKPSLVAPTEFVVSWGFIFLSSVSRFIDFDEEEVADLEQMEGAFGFDDDFLANRPDSGYLDVNAD
jgi:serine/threonine protein kinase